MQMQDFRLKEMQSTGCGSEAQAFGGCRAGEAQEPDSKYRKRQPIVRATPAFSCRGWSFTPGPMPRTVKTREADGLRSSKAPAACGRWREAMARENGRAGSEGPQASSWAQRFQRPKKNWKMGKNDN